MSYINDLKMEDRKKLALLIVNHLKSQLDSSGFTEESSESMEVAIQCIESAYSLNSTDSTNVSVKLENIVKQYYQKHDEIKVWIIIAVYNLIICIYTCLNVRKTILYLE